MSPGEIRRTMDRIEQAQRDGQRATDDRITRLAAEMVPTALFTSEHKALADDVHHLEGDTHDGFARVDATSLERTQTLRAEIKAVRADIAAVRKAQDDHVKQHEADHSWSRSKWLTVITIVVGATATIVGAWIAAVAAAGGVK